MLIRNNIHLVKAVFTATGNLAASIFWENAPVEIEIAMAIIKIETFIVLLILNWNSILERKFEENL